MPHGAKEELTKAIDPTEQPSPIVTLGKIVEPVPMMTCFPKYICQP